LFKNARILRGAAEQRHAGPELQVIRGAQDVVDRFPLNRYHELRAFYKARTENGMAKIRPGLGERGDGIPTRHSADTEPRNLGKHEPHPMTGLAAAAQLGEHAFVNGVLPFDEPLEIESIGHGTSPSCRRQNFFYAADDAVIQHHFDSMRMVRGFREDFLDGAFGQFPRALILFFDDPDAKSGPYVCASLSVHRATTS
jgi:hypothetical protein